MGNSKQTQKTKTVQDTDQKVTTPGTSFGTALLPRLEPLLDQSANTQAFTGQRVAGPVSQDQYVAQWGDAPDTIVPQRTATDTPISANVTHVDPNATEAIGAGMAAATANQGRVAPITSNLYDYWSGIAGGGGANPNLQPMLDAFTTDFNERSAVAQSQRSLDQGVDGGFGSGYGQTQAWAAEQEAQAYARQTAELRYQDFLNTQQLMQRAPEQVAQVASLATLPAEQMARYGGMRQENLIAAARAGDQNAQIALDNLWRTQTLGDTNAQLASAEGMAQREVQHQQDTARVADTSAAGAVQQGQQQAGMDNAFLAWLNQQETLNNQFANVGQAAGIAGSIPGSTSVGHATGESTTTASQQAAPWQIAAGLGGAALQAFAPGGMFSGSLSALGGASKLLPMPQQAVLPALGG